MRTMRESVVVDDSAEPLHFGVFRVIHKIHAPNKGTSVDGGDPVALTVHRRKSQRGADESVEVPIHLGHHQRRLRVAVLSNLHHGFDTNPSQPIGVVLGVTLGNVVYKLIRTSRHDAHGELTSLFLGIEVNDVYRLVRN